MKLSLTHVFEVAFNFFAATLKFQNAGSVLKDHGYEIQIFQLI